MLDSHKAVALITGGAQGIGKGIAHYLLQKGMTIVIADHDAEAGEETAQEYRVWAIFISFLLDVTDEAPVQRVVATTLDHYGRLNALVNNAGIANPGNTPVEHLTLDAWNKVIATNLTGYFLCAKYAALICARRAAPIVNIASTRALQSEANTEAYAASGKVGSWH